jgi:hypothetical protein
MRPMVRVACFSALGVAACVGVAFYVTASNGTKQADFGTALMSAAVIGVLVVFFERSLRRETTQIRRDTSHLQDAVEKSAAPPPEVDVPPPDVLPVDLSTGVERGVRETASGASLSARQQYKVQYDGWQRDSRRIDAYQARLRVLREDGIYFQFFSAVMSGIAIRTGLGTENGLTAATFRNAVADVGSELARQAISERRAPLDEPTVAIEVFPDPEQVMQRATVARPTEYGEGEVFTTIWA